MKFKETIQKVKNEYDIVDYIIANGVNLESSGSDTWKGLCPFHNEKTASFTVSENFQNYKCFGCGASGDILSFAQNIHMISFYEAVKMLAEEKGIKLDDKVASEITHDISGIRQVIFDAKEFFRYNYNKLDESHPAKQEILKRGLRLDNELYGFSLEAPNELYKFLKGKGHPDKNIKDSNLVMFFEDNRQPWDFFHGRLMITLSDYLGRPVSFTSRKVFVDDKMKGKYVNGRESPVFHKKSNLFGSDIAKQDARNSKTVYVVEGQFDQIAMTEKGIKNVVATSGTAITEEHANLLLRMVGDSGKIVFIMDGDNAGREAAIKAFTTIKSLHSNSYAVLLSENKDPCDYIIAGKLDLLNKAIERAVPLHDFVVDSTLNSFGGSINMGNRQRFVAQVAKYAKSSDDTFVINNMLSKASVLSAISIDSVENIYRKTKADSSYVREDVSIDKKALNPIVELDMNNEADICMFSALALLVRAPDELISKTPKRIHKKFQPFLKELGERYKLAKQNNKKWRFISEDYTDSDFAIALQNKKFLENPKDDIESTASQYEYLFSRANDLYKKEYERMRKAKALSSIVDSTDPQEIAKALRTYKSSQE